MESKRFKIQELVPLYIYKKYGNSAWRFIDKDVIVTLDKLKEVFPKGTITINDWLWSGEFNWSGFRTPKSPHYSETSMHSLGKAMDCKFTAYTSEEVREYIIANPDVFPLIKGIELEVSWFHFDCRNTKELHTFKG